MSFMATARVAPEKQTHHLPAAGFFCGAMKVNMINFFHATVIEKCREKARSDEFIGEIFTLLAKSFPAADKGDFTFYGDEETKAYLAAVIQSGVFVAVDMQTSEAVEV